MSKAWVSGNSGMGNTGNETLVLTREKKDKLESISRKAGMSKSWDSGNSGTENPGNETLVMTREKKDRLESISQDSGNVKIVGFREFGNGKIPGMKH
jgi:hypothetical protein